MKTCPTVILCHAKSGGVFASETAAAKQAAAACACGTCIIWYWTASGMLQRKSGGMSRHDFHAQGKTAWRARAMLRQAFIAPAAVLSMP